MFTLKSASLKATILSRGATLSGLWSTGRDRSLVLGSPDMRPYSGDLQYFGAIVGPVANRIANAAITIDGKTWRMPANEGPTSLHSGPDGLHARDWVLADQSATHVTLTSTLAHGEGGLPGTREITARYDLDGDNRLRLVLMARSDRTTVMNLAHHPYWVLDGHDTVAQHRLMVRADSYLPTDARTLPLGEVRAVAGSPYDFRTPRAVPTDRLLDANLCLAGACSSDLREAARLEAPDGLRLTLHTTEPGLQVYNGFGLAPTDAPLHDGRPLRPCAGLALEPQGWPDAPRHAQFPSILLPTDTLYRQVTVYEISG